jgi:hypothetical protein
VLNLARHSKKNGVFKMLTLLKKEYDYIDGTHYYRELATFFDYDIAEDYNNYILPKKYNKEKYLFVELEIFTGDYHAYTDFNFPFTEEFEKELKII